MSGDAASGYRVRKFFYIFESEMKHLVLVVIALASATSCSCALLLNSPFEINATTSAYYCPSCGEFTCIEESEMGRICENLTGDSTLVFEPCSCCKTCARLERQPCGGPYGSNGTCKDGLRCTVPFRDYLTQANASVGSCQHKVCWKNCSNFRVKHKCGDNGQWYDNICALRQANCNHTDTNIRKVKEADSTSVCDQVCDTLPTLTDGEVHYSNGVVPGSVATFTCNHGYELSQESPARATCHNRQWSNTVDPLCLPNPCQNTYCHVGSKCVLDVDLNAECQCLEDSECPGVVDYVCGSDGVTYDNLCQLQAHSCRVRHEVEVQHDGECLPERDINSR